MNHNDLSSKLAQVIEQIPRDVLYDFCCSYAQEHEELAMALVNEFWRPGKDDYRSMVQHIVHFSHAREKEPKSALPPRPPSKGDAIDYGQRPPFIKVLVSLSSLCPFGVRDKFFYH